MWPLLLLALAAEGTLTPSDPRLRLLDRTCPNVSNLPAGKPFRLHAVLLKVDPAGVVKSVAPVDPNRLQPEMRALLDWRFAPLPGQSTDVTVQIPEYHEWLFFTDPSAAARQQQLDRLAVPDSPEKRSQLLALARDGYWGARLAAASLSRQGRLPELDPRLASDWFAAALAQRMPQACLEEAKFKLDNKKPADPELLCALESRLPEAMYLWARLLLDRTGAEDEPHRFEGLGYLALAAQTGYSPAVRRWELLAAELPLEDLERVEQTTKQLTQGQ